MKLKHYLKNINNLVKAHPECLEFVAISASDDEGNSFSEVIFSPTLVEFDGQDVIDDESDAPNAVCIN